MESNNTQKLEENDPTSSRMRVGTDIIKHLSTTFYPRPLIIFDEILSNARDAMATEVKISVNNDNIVIEDNGEGMSPEELTRFFYISYSTKPTQPIKIRNNIRRAITGKFGIGKLSLYQICRLFKIITWKDGITSESSFDFSAFESKKFVDDFLLKVESRENSSNKTGTKLVLQDLKRYISSLDIRRHITRTMPLTKDFNVTISSPELAHPLQLKSEDVLHGKVHKIYDINESVKGVGKITGSIAYKNTETGDFGVYVRVLGRLVNLNNPHGIINFSNLTHAYMFARRIYIDINVDSLNDALQTNRAGFVTDHPAYINFQKWLITTLNKRNAEVNKELNEEKKGVEIFKIKETFSDLLEKKFSLAEDQRPGKTTKSLVEKSKASTREKNEDENPLMVIQGKEISIEIEPLGPEEPEAIFDSKRNVIVINSNNPLYELSRTKGGAWGVQYHALKSAIVIFALKKSKNLEEFKKNYDILVKQSEELVSNMTRRFVIIK